MENISANQICESRKNIELQFLIDKIRDVPGDIVELGVWTGNNAVEFIWQAKEKKYVGFDTFKGYTDEDIDASPNQEDLRENNTGRWGPWEQWNGALDTIKRIQNFKNLLDSDGVLLADFEIVEGDLKDTLPQYIKENKIQKIAMLYVDCNVYPAALRGIEAAWPIMSKGSIICIDEHQEGGETKALKEFAKKNNQEIIETGFPFVSGPSSNPSKYIIKK